MNRVRDEKKTKTHRPPGASFDNDDIPNTLRFVASYIKRCEDTRNDQKKNLLFENPLLSKKWQRSCNKYQHSMAQSFVQKFSSGRGFSCVDEAYHAEMYLCLGFAHEKGLFGAEKNYFKAFEFYLLSAQLNNRIATFKVAQCYEKGMGCERDVEKALYFYRCAAKLGLPDAMHTYGAIILFGGIRYDGEQEVGLFYLRLAVRNATTQYPFAFYDLARCYERNMGPRIVGPDESYAFKLYARGASLNCPNCQYRVAKCYEGGELGSERDARRALEWYNKAAELGQSDAQYALSGFFLHGVKGLLKKNHRMSLYYALTASIQEHTSAAYSLAEFYEYGIGTKRNMSLASWWSKVAEEFKRKHKDVVVERARLAFSDKSSSDNEREMEANPLPGLIASY
jgi:uncharacterized protein